MTSAVIVSTARTPLAKSWKGAFNMTHGATLGSFAVKAAVDRAGIDPGARAEAVPVEAYVTLSNQLIAAGIQPPEADAL